MKTKQYFIYLTTNLINGKQYIGQHYGYVDDSYLGSGVQLTRAIEKYGKENFHRAILCFCENAEDANIQEQKMIAKYDAVLNNNFYNIAPGGHGIDAKTINAAKIKWQMEHPEEHQAQVNAWREAGTIANSKRVRCITTGEEFASLCEAGRRYNIPQGNISKCLSGERKSAGKHPETGAKLFWELIE